jgi:hypothetical protein
LSYFADPDFEGDPWVQVYELKGFEASPVPLDVVEELETEVETDDRYPQINWHFGECHGW